MASTSSEYYIESLICECEKILAGEYGDSEQQKIDELMEEMEGFRFPLMCTQSIQILRDRTPRGVRKVKGWLIANIATLMAQGGSTTVKAEANANAAVDVSVAMTQTIRMLDGCSASKEEIDALKAKDNGYRIFGYSTDPETRCYVIDEAEANAVREMFSMHISGNSVNSIAREMASRGWTTTTGKPVDYNWAWRVLNRKAYTGLYSWGGIEVPGGMPQIIDEVTFARSQAVVPRKRRKDENWDVYRLTGKLYCGLCGKPMHGTAGTGKKGKRYHYYACRESDGCRRPWVRRELLEDSIADAVLETCSDEGRMRMLARRIVEAYAEPGEEEAEMASIEAQIASLEREQHNMTQAAMKGFVTDEMVARNDEIKAQLKNLHNRHGILACQMCEITEDDIVGYMMHGFNRDDEDFIFGSIVREAYLFDDCVLLVFNFRDEVGDLTEIRVALQAQKKCEPGGGFALCSSGVPGEEFPEPISLPGGFGLIIPLRRAA